MKPNHSLQTDPELVDGPLSSNVIRPNFKESCWCGRCCSDQVSINIFTMADLQDQDDKQTFLYLIDDTIVPYSDLVEGVVPFHFGSSWVRQAFSQTIYSVSYFSSVGCGNLLEGFSRRSFELNAVFQRSSSLRSFSHGIFSPGSARAFHASSMSIRSSIS